MNQPPQTEKQTGKRIVSKGKYVEIVGQSLAMSLMSIALIAATVACAIIGLLFTALFFFSLRDIRDGGVLGFLLCLVMCLVPLFLFGVGTVLLGKLTASAIKSASDIGSITPLTRANTADLPAPDSLVRASEEPVQEPQAVLLRAATASVERHEEQLVRASAERAD